MLRSTDFLYQTADDRNSLGRLKVLRLDSPDAVANRFMGGRSSLMYSRTHRSLLVYCAAQ